MRGDGTADCRTDQAAGWETVLVRRLLMRRSRWGGARGGGCSSVISGAWVPRRSCGDTLGEEVRVSAVPLLFAVLSACSPASTDSDAVANVVDSDAPAVETDSDEPTAALVGTPPAAAVLAPEFTATNADGSERNRESLLGKPHVLWFFPSAGTFG